MGGTPPGFSVAAGRIRSHVHADLASPTSRYLKTAEDLAAVDPCEVLEVGCEHDPSYLQRVANSVGPHHGVDPTEFSPVLARTSVAYTRGDCGRLPFLSVREHPAYLIRHGALHALASLSERLVTVPIKPLRPWLLSAA